VGVAVICLGVGSGVELGVGTGVGRGVGFALGLGVGWRLGIAVMEGAAVEGVDVGTGSQLRHVSLQKFLT
jgi:hypothetical protein